MSIFWNQVKETIDVLEDARVVILTGLYAIGVGLWAIGRGLKCAILVVVLAFPIDLARSVVEARQSLPPKA